MFGGLQVAYDQLPPTLFGDGWQHAARNDLQRGPQTHTQVRRSVVREVIKLVELSFLGNLVFVWASVLNYNNDLSYYATE